MFTYSRINFPSYSSMNIVINAHIKILNCLLLVMSLAYLFQSIRWSLEVLYSCKKCKIILMLVLPCVL